MLGKQLFRMQGSVLVLSLPGSNGKEVVVVVEIKVASIL